MFPFYFGLFNNTINTTTQSRLIILLFTVAYTYKLHIHSAKFYTLEIGLNKELEGVVVRKWWNSNKS
jgi:hypothetical protein